MTQAQAIKAHLEQYGSINPIEALNLFDCYRLSARIMELRTTMKIDTVRVPYTNYKGKKKVRTEYRMVG